MFPIRIIYLSPSLFFPRLFVFIISSLKPYTISLTFDSVYTPRPRSYTTQPLAERIPTDPRDTTFYANTRPIRILESPFSDGEQELTTNNFKR